MCLSLFELANELVIVCTVVTLGNRGWRLVANGGELSAVTRCLQLTLSVTV